MDEAKKNKTKKKKKKIVAEPIIGKFGLKLAELIVDYPNLQHLDLSSNNFYHLESKAIADALDQNHTMYGFHFGGNFGELNERMFLKVFEKSAE